jgi:TRAP-type C4-dicarboxylate transport system permease small subunit
MGSLLFCVVLCLILALGSLKIGETFWSAERVILGVPILAFYVWRTLFPDPQQSLTARDAGELALALAFGVSVGVVAVHGHGESVRKNKRLPSVALLSCMMYCVFWGGFVVFGLFWDTVRWLNRAIPIP